MISRYFIIFPIGCLGEPNVYQNMVDFTSTRYFTWRLSDFEESMGHTGTNTTNHFMYQWEGPLCYLPLLFKLFQLIHLNQAFV